MPLLTNRPPDVNIYYSLDRPLTGKLIVPSNKLVRYVHQTELVLSILIDIHQALVKHSSAFTMVDPVSRQNRE